jgi:hypothetical protein
MGMVRLKPAALNQNYFRQSLRDYKRCVARHIFCLGAKLLLKLPFCIRRVSVF